MKNLELKEGKEVKEMGVKVSAFQCPHCSKLMKTKRGIENHISSCKKNPKYFSEPIEMGVDGKGRVFDKRISLRYSNGSNKSVALFIENRFSHIMEINGETPSFIRYPRKFDFEFVKL
ncbi:hypothetical protein [Formosa sp. L2A11]|uniref:hypothetical protein n=1 Tax=Formosa sp. L2A11 TaxID=2686363 RepID=UPI00131AADF2|nr:hypothetical protein [Formosa sp. L2A11]